MAKAESSNVEYRTIDRFPGYSFGSDGSVWSHKFRKDGGWSISSNRIHKLARNFNGRQYQVYLNVDGVGKSYLLHRLILEAFIGPCPEGMECCHFDGDTSNNRVSNLRWDTRSNNHADKKRHGTYQEGEKANKAIFTNSQVADIKGLMVDGFTDSQIAKMYAAKRATIKAIRLGRNWKCIRVDGFYPRIRSDAARAAAKVV